MIMIMIDYIIHMKRPPGQSYNTSIQPSDLATHSSSIQVEGISSGRLPTKALTARSCLLDCLNLIRSHQFIQVELADGLSLAAGRPP